MRNASNSAAPERQDRRELPLACPVAERNSRRSQSPRQSLAAPLDLPLAHPARFQIRDEPDPVALTTERLPVHGDHNISRLQSRLLRRGAWEYRAHQHTARGKHGLNTRRLSSQENKVESKSQKDQEGRRHHVHPPWRAHRRHAGLLCRPRGGIIQQGLLSAHRDGKSAGLPQFRWYAAEQDDGLKLIEKMVAAERLERST